MAEQFGHDSLHYVHLLTFQQILLLPFTLPHQHPPPLPAFSHYSLSLSHVCGSAYTDGRLEHCFCTTLTFTRPFTFWFGLVGREPGFKTWRQRHACWRFYPLPFTINARRWLAAHLGP